MILNAHTQRRVKLNRLNLILPIIKYKDEVMNYRKNLSRTKIAWVELVV